MNKILIVGTVAFDAIETPFGKTDRILGGAGTFIALAASKYQIPIGLVSIVGGDFPKKYLDMLVENGIDISGIEVVEDGKTFFWSGRYEHDLNVRHTLETQLNVLENFNPKVPNEYGDADIVVLGNLHPIVQLDVLEQMKRRPKLIILDTMNFWIDNALDDLKKIIRKVDIISINDEEARQLSGEYSLVKAAMIIRKMGPKYIIIKKGEHGALLFGEGTVFFAPALPLEEVFDPTGAGDSFAGGFTGYLAKRGKYSSSQLKNATIHGCNMASFSVEQFGTERMQSLSKEQCYKRLEQFIDLTHFDIDY